jgi:hypothetical protein
MTLDPDAPDGIRDEFLSEEDLDLATLSLSEVLAWWEIWFRQAQDTNDADEWIYSHGVFDEVPVCARLPRGRVR